MLIIKKLSYEKMHNNLIHLISFCGMLRKISIIRLKIYFCPQYWVLLNQNLFR